MRNESFLTGPSGAAPLAARAAAQHGVVTVADLRAAGLTGSAVSKRVKRGALHPIHPGVYAYAHPALSEQGRWLAAVFAGGEGSALGLLAAAALILRIDRFALGEPDVLVPRRHRPVPGVRLHTAGGWTGVTSRPAGASRSRPSRACWSISATC